MAYLQIYSENPNFSYIISKNPETGMLLRKMQSGYATGWYSKNNSVFNVYFKDDNDYSSFSNNPEMEYVDSQRYCAPEFVQKSIKTFFNDLINKESEYDTINKYKHTMFVNMFEMKNKIHLEKLLKHTDGFELKALENVVGNSYRIEISTVNSFKSLINFMYVLSVFYSIMNNKNSLFDDSEITKLTKALSNIKAPYFIIYIIKSRLIRSPKVFKANKETLENAAKENVTLFHGSTDIFRKEFITNEIKYRNNILDIGCGELRVYGKYVKRKALEKGLNYYGVETDEKLFNWLKDNPDINKGFKIYYGLSRFIRKYNNEKVDIILSEVIEHMDYSDACKLLEFIIKHINFEKIIITTPNKTFNKYYSFSDEDKRHDDHYYELTNNEFKNLISNVFINYKYRFNDIGDVVNDETSTSAAVIENV